MVGRGLGGIYVADDRHTGDVSLAAREEQQSKWQKERSPWQRGWLVEQ